MGQMWDVDPDVAGYPQFGRPLPPQLRDFERIPARLASRTAKVILVGIPDEFGRRQMWHLAGEGTAGREGAMLASEVSGLMHAPFKATWTETPFAPGGRPGHVAWPRREINVGVLVGTEPHVSWRQAPGGHLTPVYPQDSPERYRLIEDRFWNSLSAEDDSFLVVFTRSHGYRWLKVRLASESKTTLAVDPTLYGNNCQLWELPLVTSGNPFWQRLPRMAGPWRNTEATSTPIDLVEEILGNLVPGIDCGEGHLTIRNDGDRPAYPVWLVDPGTGGFVWLQDGATDRMVRLPKLANGETALVSTAPYERCLTGAFDEVDSVFYGLATASKALDFVLHDLAGIPDGVALWRRGADVQFTSPIPPKTTVTLKVRASNARASVSVKLPQHYDRPWS